MCMHTQLQNGILYNGEQLQSVVNGFIDQGEFKVMKTLSCRETLYFDKQQFHATITVSTRTVFELSLLNKFVRTKNKENGTFATAQFCV